MTTTNEPVPGTWEQKRRAYVTEEVAPRVAVVFDEHPELRSVAMLVAQYWNDEADDAVHASFVFSVLDEPDLDAWAEAHDDDSVNAPGIDTWRLWELLHLGASRLPWDSNGAAIPLFASVCPEGGSQDADPLSSYATYAVLRRVPGGVDVEFVGEALRPWLDGVAPSWEQ
jgi:hypothetical protein